MKVNDKVIYSQPFPDEQGIEYTIIEINEVQDWCQIQANLGWSINPVYVANVSELTKIN